MLNKFINKKYLQEKKINKLKDEFKDNKPFHYLVLKDFFDDYFIEQFTKELLKQEFIKQESDLFSFKQTDDLRLIKNKIIKKFYNIFNSKEFKKYLKNITKIKAYGQIDCSGFIYGECAYLLPHDDRLENRKIAYVLNLSNDFKNNDGEELLFYDKNKIFKKIKPEFNTLVIFKVEINKTFHEVKEVISNKKRISIAGWFNDK